jgi:hypothetical protein
MRRDLALCFLFSAILLALYWPVQHHDFLWYDDQLFVVQNPDVQAGVNWQSLRYAFSAVIACNWHPVTVLSHMLDCQLFGVNSGPQHLVNVAFHIGNTLLLFLLVKRLTGAFWRSAIVAALFAVHPLRVESVAWLAERKDVLSTFFFLLTLWAYARYAEARGSGVLEWWSIGKRKSEGRNPKAERNPKSEIRNPVSGSQHSSTPALHCAAGARFYALALGFFALGLMSKPMLVTTPFVLLLLDYWPLGRLAAANPKPEIQHSNTPPLRSSPTPTLQLLWEKLPFILLSAASCWVTLRVQQRYGGMEPSGQTALASRVSNAVVSYVRYLGKAVWPTRLAVLYPHPARHYAHSDQWPAWQIVCAALLLLAITALCVCQLRRRPWAAFGWFWFLGTLVPVIGLVQVGAQAMADRYTYIPLIGPTVVAVWFVGEFWGPARGRRIFLAALTVVVLAACALVTRRQLGYWQNTITLAEHTLEVTPDNPTPQALLGLALMQEGKLSMGASYLRAALAIDPRNTLAHLNLGIALKRQGALAQAAEEYRAVTRLEPALYPAHLALVDALRELGRTKEAIQEMDETLRVYADPRYDLSDNFARVHTVDCLNDLAWALATNPAAERRDGAAAVRFAERACGLMEPKQTLMLGTLAAAYAEAGRFPEAVATAEAACAQALVEKAPALWEKNQQLLKLYQAGKPCHEPLPQG